MTKYCCGLSQRFDRKTGGPNRKIYLFVLLFLAVLLAIQTQASTADAKEHLYLKGIEITGAETGSGSPPVDLTPINTKCAKVGDPENAATGTWSDHGCLGAPRDC